MSSPLSTGTLLGKEGTSSISIFFVTWPLLDIWLTSIKSGSQVLNGLLGTSGASVKLHPSFISTSVSCLGIKFI